MYRVIKTESQVPEHVRASIVHNLEVLVVLTVFIACAGTRGVRSGDDQTLERLRTEIEAINRQMEGAVAGGDMLAVAAYYADDARLIGPRGQEVRGRSAIDTYWSRIQGAKAWQLEAFEIGGGVNQAYQFGRSTLVQTLPTGERKSVTDFVVIWKRGQDGRLRIALDFYH
jgi:ketosteroid isomerase-like protein